MSAFTPAWLALREPADHFARSALLAHAIADRLRPSGRVRALDLGTGTGSNVRYMMERLSGDQDWLLADHDPALLTEAAARISSWATARGYDVDIELDQFVITLDPLTTRIASRCVDLSAIVTARDGDLLKGRSLVTASALLDLVSDEWLSALADSCRNHAVTAVLFALTYDGRLELLPREAEDEAVRALVNEHQHKDKGFGPALGPDAITAAERSFVNSGFDVRRERTDWALAPDARELQTELIVGWTAAAIEVAPSRAGSIRDWARRRLTHINERRSRMLVGHEDFAATRLS